MPDNPWANGHNIETLRQVAAGIIPDVRDFKATAVNAGGLPAEWIIANGTDRGRATILYFHGGAYLCGHPKQYRNITVWLSRLANAAAFEDAKSAYRWLLESGADDQSQWENPGPIVEISSEGPIRGFRT